MHKQEKEVKIGMTCSDAVIKISPWPDKNQNGFPDYGIHAPHSPLPYTPLPLPDNVMPPPSDRSLPCSPEDR